MKIREYKVVADFYPDKVAKQIQKLMDEDWELVEAPQGMYTATLNFGRLAPEELEIYPVYRDQLFYAVMAKYENVDYDEANVKA